MRTTTSHVESCSWPLKAFLPLFFPVINGGWIANAISVRRINIKRSSSTSDYLCSGVMIGVYRKVAVVEKSTSEVGRFSTVSSPVAENRSISMTSKGHIYTKKSPIPILQKSWAVNLCPLYRMVKVWIRFGHSSNFGDIVKSGGDRVPMPPKK